MGNIYLQKIKQSALIFLFLLTVSVVYAQNPTFDSLANEVNRLSHFKKTKSLELLDSLYQIAYSDPDSSLLIARCLYEEAFLYRRQGIVDTLLAERIKNRLDRENLPLQEQALLQLTLANNLLAAGKYSDAFSFSLQALERFKQLENNRFISRAYHILGNICNNIKLYNLAMYYYSEAIKNIMPESYEYFWIKINLFGTEFNFNKNETMIDSMLCLLKIAEKEEKEELFPSLYLNIGILMADIYPEKALMYLTKMQSLDFDSPNLTAVLYANIGYHYLLHDDYSQTLNYFRDARKIMEENNNFPYLSFLYINISLIFEVQNMPDSALFYARKYEELILQLHSNTIAIETHQKYITTLFEASQKDLVIAEQTVALKNRQFIIIIIVSASVVLLISLFLLFVNQQKRRKASENRELTAKLAHEEKVQQYEAQRRKLEKEKQKEVLDAKTREITSYSLLVSDKHTLLKKIMDLNTRALNDEENREKTLKRVGDIITGSLSVDGAWETFKMHFDKVHPHFFKKLKRLCGDLTEENLKMSAYIKMGMSTKQIAQLLNIANSSVVISRHRIKKKLKLPEKENLTHFIGSL